MKQWVAALLALASGAAMAEQMPERFKEAYSSYQLPYYADAVAVADMTGDGRDDIVAVTSDRARLEADDRAVYLFVQQPDGLLQVPWRYEYNARSQHVGLALIDLNGDGAKDIVLSHLDGLTLMVNTGNPEARFVITQRPGSPERMLTTADIDLDGRMDVVTVSYQNEIRVHYNNGNGGIRSTATLPLSPGNIRFLRFADMNGDRLPDLVVSAGNTIDVYARNHAGFSYSTGLFPSSDVFAIGDFNGDGLPDVTSDYQYSYPVINYQQPGHWFGPAVRIPGYSRTGPTLAADLNGDGRVDRMHMARTLGGFYSNLQGSSGMQEQALDYLPLDSDLNDGNGIAAGDINSDGCPDVVMAIDNEGLVWFYGSSCVARTDLAATLGVDASTLSVRLANVWWGVTPVQSPSVDIDVKAVAPATLQLGTLPPGCRVLAHATDSARVLCSAATLPYGAQAQFALPLQVASPTPSAVVVAVTARTSTPEVRLDNNRAAKRIAIAATAPVNKASRQPLRSAPTPSLRKRTTRAEAHR